MDSIERILREIKGSPPSTLEQTLRVQLTLSEEYVPKLRLLMRALPTSRHPIAGDRLVMLARQGLEQAIRSRNRARAKFGYSPALDEIEVPPEAPPGAPPPSE